jgi:cutinase
MPRLRMLAAVTAAAATALIAPTLSTATAHADPCIGSWSIGIGGFTMTGPGITGQDSGYLNVNQRVGYNSADPNSGLRELDRLIWQHRNTCPTDHLKLLGHSEGAGLIHVWVSQHQWFPNANAVLLADPKRVAGPGSAGIAGNPLAPHFPGPPLAGVDADFGDFPVLEVCNGDDWICNEEAGPIGYAVKGVHGDYMYSADAYGDWDSGVWFR